MFQNDQTEQLFLTTQVQPGVNFVDKIGLKQTDI